MGQVRDIQTRLRHVRTCFVEKVKQARKLIYTDGRPINGVHVERLLKETSSVPTENVFVERLGITDFDFSKLLVVDFLHEFELGVWKTLFKHLIRVLYACPNGADKVSELDARLCQVSTFGVSTIRRFANNASEMKKLAARDFEDLLQCAIPAFEGLLPNEHDVRLMKLLYRLGEWHALAKLRMHTDETLESLASCTPLVGTLMREFRDKSCSQFQTVELPSEQQARSRRQAQIAAQYPTDSASRKPQATERKIRTLNLFTYKFHAMADYIHAIPWFGTIDSYSTQLGELAHRLVKRLYGLTNKREPEGQIGRRYKRAQLLSKARIAKERANLKGKGRAVEVATPSGVREEMAHAHQVGFGYGERPEDLIIPLQAHHFMSSRRDHPVDLTPFLQQEPLDPSKKDFLPKLEDHLLGRLRGIPFDGDYEFTDKEWQLVVIMNERIYSVKTLRINYTTYDVRRDQDVINPSTDHCTVLLNSPETQHNAHCYWYAQVLGIFHADIIHLDTAMGSVKSKERMEFLWVRWLGIEPDYRFGSKAARLPKVGFIPENDDFAFGFLDPLHVIRACHLIPDFVRGQTNELLGTSLPTAARKAGESSDWWNYYVMIFVDRDMFMRYRGGGVGHIDLQSSEDYGVSPGSEDEDGSDKLVMVAGGQSNPDDEEQLDSEEFDSDDDSEAAEHNWLLDYLDPSHQYDSSDDLNESESSSE
ncbi:hypothetical protein C8R41DRAFT_832720 [Lentinula lateritia]|uniref:HNH nuclease domain-containing protein n=1 Tax=Lentinula lateritia TaxID=40482 RepID=A0ABQ8VF49_9AGAR|nr:hypothetical protein C8R41DRAFT_832720 [Lentinula lateritia]